MSTWKPGAKRPRISLFGVLFDIILDLVLVSAGILLYVHFFVTPLLPFAVDVWFGGSLILRWVICGLPFLLGIVNLFRTLGRVVRAMFGK